MKKKSPFKIFTMYIKVTFFIFFSISLFLANPLSAQQSLTVSDIYIVTKGDTLWNISDKFFGDPFLWPALWQINPHIKDPHWIYPGEIVNLKKLFPISQAFSPMPPPPRRPEKLLEEKPEKEISEIEKPAYATTQEKIDSVSFLMPQKDFHLKQKNENWGQITDTKEKKISLSYMDHIYINLGINTVVPGQRMTIFRIGRDLKNNQKLNRPHYLIIVLGQADILEVYDNMSLAKIIKSYSEISVGDFVKPYEAMPRPIFKPANIKEFEGEIVESEEPKENLAEFDIIFLNKGTWDGLESGNPLEIFRLEDVQIGPQKNDRKKVIKTLGELLILRGDEWTSTAQIIKSYQPIKLGDHVRVHQD